jgi:hypothetical protein
LVSSSIDLGSRLRKVSISPAATAVNVTYTASGSNCALGKAGQERAGIDGGHFYSEFLELEAHCLRDRLYSVFGRRIDARESIYI